MCIPGSAHCANMELCRGIRLPSVCSRAGVVVQHRRTRGVERDDSADSVVRADGMQQHDYILACILASVVRNDSGEIALICCLANAPSASSVMMVQARRWSAALVTSFAPSLLTVAIQRGDPEQQTL